MERRLKKAKTISEKVNEQIALHANSDEDSGDASDADAASNPRVAEFDEEEYDLPDPRSTEIRKRNIKLLSEQSVRYRGKIASRKELELEVDDDDDEEEEDEDDSESDLATFRKKIKEAQQISDGHSASGTDTDRDDHEDSEQEEESSEDEDAPDSLSGDDDADDHVAIENPKETDMITETSRQAEIQKGQCVQHQLRIWEKLLEIRIHSQKMLNKSNQLPLPANFQQQLCQSADLKSATEETKQKVGNLLSSLLKLKHALCSQTTEVRNAMKDTLKRSASMCAESQEDMPPIKRIAENLDSQFNEFRTYRNTVLLKWDDRTKLLTPGAGGKKKSLSDEFDIVRKIENALASNRSALIEKSRSIKGASAADAEEADANTAEQMSTTSNANIFDDSDFYHQQLRELIEYKANTSADMNEVTKQYVELQKLRQKMKKKVDTRASKGRKLRYVVHNKLLNFMAPDNASNWTDASKDELYKSLFV